MTPPHNKNIVGQTKKNLFVAKKKKIKIPHLIFSIHGNGDTIRIGQEIQCLPSAGFFRLKMLQIVLTYISNISKSVKSHAKYLHSQLSL